MRTPEEIKNLLKKYNNFPYNLNELFADSLTYIEQLEAERDEAISDMTELMRGSGYCTFCKYFSEDGECTRLTTEGRAMCWQWRGVQKGVVHD